MKPQAIEVTI